MLYPQLRIRVNRPRTREVVEQLRPKYWPKVGDEALDKALDSLDGSMVDISTGLRALSSAEDGAVALKPGSRVTIKVTWTVNPVYQLNKWGAKKLNRWLNSVKAIDVSYGEVDYSMKSRTKVRVMFTIDAAAKAYLEVPGITIPTFLTMAGGWVGMVTLFYMVLKFWQVFTIAY